MKTINDDPQGFFDHGGWSFLDPESDVSLFESKMYLLYIVVRKVTGQPLPIGKGRQYFPIGYMYLHLFNVLCVVINCAYTTVESLC